MTLILAARGHQTEKFLWGSNFHQKVIWPMVVFFQISTSAMSNAI